jgi:hypothetical protein
MSKRNVSNAMKRCVGSEQGWKCNFCHAMLGMAYEVDHKVPLWNHGLNHRSNLQALCANCHAHKTYWENLPCMDQSMNVRVCLKCHVVFSPYFNHAC